MKETLQIKKYKQELRKIKKTSILSLEEGIKLEKQYKKLIEDSFDFMYFSFENCPVLSIQDLLDYRKTYLKLQKVRFEDITFQEYGSSYFLKNLKQLREKNKIYEIHDNF